MPPAAREVEHGEIGDQPVDDAAAGQRQRAFAAHLRGPVAREVLHHHHDPTGAADEVHRPAHPLDHLPGDHPVREVAVLRDLHAAEDREVDVAAADHRERLRAVEERRARNGRHRLLAGVDQVRVLLAGARIGPDPEQAVLRLQQDPGQMLGVVGEQRRQADPEVHVHPLAELLRGARDDPHAGVGAHASRTVRRSIRFS